MKKRSREATKWGPCLCGLLGSKLRNRPCLVCPPSRAQFHNSGFMIFFANSVYSVYLVPEMYLTLITRMRQF